MRKPDYGFTQGHLCAARAVLEEASYAAMGDSALELEVLAALESVRAVIATVERRVAAR